LNLEKSQKADDDLNQLIKEYFDF